MATISKPSPKGTGNAQLAHSGDDAGHEECVGKPVVVEIIADSPGVVP